jgi:hypothetical protein
MSGDGWLCARIDIARTRIGVGPGAYPPIGANRVMRLGLFSAR